MKPSQTNLIALSLLAAALILPAGCDKKADSKANYIKAINTYYASEPACLWETNIKLPVQAAAADTAKTAPYDALVDQGLLLRTTAEKKVFLIASKQVTHYDLSDKGRQAWTPDVQNPGFGNFCYGTPHVASLESAVTRNDATFGPVMDVHYHAEVTAAPAWATAAETRNAFPKLQLDLSTPLPETAMLKLTPDGYSVARGVARRTAVVPKDPDSSIVQ